jgi:hypothetical protein
VQSRPDLAVSRRHRFANGPFVSAIGSYIVSSTDDDASPGNECIFRRSAFVTGIGFHGLGVPIVHFPSALIRSIRFSRPRAIQSAPSGSTPHTSGV